MTLIEYFCPIISYKYHLCIQILDKYQKHSYDGKCMVLQNLLSIYRNEIVFLCEGKLELSGNTASVYLRYRSITKQKFDYSGRFER